MDKEIIPSPNIKNVKKNIIYLILHLFDGLFDAVSVDSVHINNLMVKNIPSCGIYALSCEVHAFLITRTE